MSEAARGAESGKGSEAPAFGTGFPPWRGNKRNPGPMSGPKADPRTERLPASHRGV
ncbi:hypothetical protein [Paenibacillus xylanexedens]|uniref:hypothetical protein n=1 Tax=Paenibacillus xylanexedens TaxID=528191 RepID=UPI001643F6E7|nr:hypothetical protein [Paenibacillus xylanexedens]